MRRPEWTQTEAPQYVQPPGESHTERIFHHFFAQRDLFSAIPHRVWSPPTDVYETRDEYVIKVEIPGIKEKDISMELNHNVLTIQGYRRDSCSDSKLSYAQMEIHYGYFEKVVTLPHSIDPDQRSARYRDGFLHVRIGKAEPKSRRRQIKIDS
ncbi:MAG: Hsp20/alpha crystallin family protein [Planctomycetota bacterium]